ncbi:MAG: KH domain-containing protein, partial [bacterium]
MNLKELIEYIAKALVDHPDRVEVKEISGEKTLIYELRVGQGDLGTVIGTEGGTSKSIRALLAEAAL